MFTITRAAGVSPDRSGNVYLPTELEQEMIALFAPFRAGRKGVWLTAEPRQYLAGLPNDAPGDFVLRDRAFNALFTPDAVGQRHPVLVIDATTGKPCWCFGNAGVGPNLMDTGMHNGALIAASILKKGVEANRPDLFAQNTGWSAAARVLVPAANATVNGVTFTATGGGIIGGGASDPLHCPVMFVDRDVGKLRAFNQLGVTTSGQWYEDTVDRRNGVWQTLMVTYDDAAGAYSGYAGNTLLSTLTGVTTDIVTDAGVGCPMVGGVGSGVSGPGGQFFGFLKGVVLFPTAVLNQSGPRSIVTDYLATL